MLYFVSQVLCKQTDLVLYMQEVKTCQIIQKFTNINIFATIFIASFTLSRQPALKTCQIIKRNLCQSRKFISTFNKAIRNIFYSNKRSDGEACTQKSQIEIKHITIYISTQRYGTYVRMDIAIYECATGRWWTHRLGCGQVL